MHQVKCITLTSVVYDYASVWFILCVCATIFSVVIVKDDIINKIPNEYRKMCGIVLSFFFASHTFVHWFVLCLCGQCICRTDSPKQWMIPFKIYSVRSCTTLRQNCEHKNEQDKKLCRFLCVFMPNIFHWLFHSQSIRYAMQLNAAVQSQPTISVFEIANSLNIIENIFPEIEHLKIGKNCNRNHSIDSFRYK